MNRRIMKKIFNRLAVLAAVSLLGAVSGCSGQKQLLDPSAPTVEMCIRDRPNMLSM